MLTLNFIDTGSHGYLKVPRELFLKHCDPMQISSYSGMDSDNIYLEEDADAGIFLEAAKNDGQGIVFKEVYDERFNKTHNYNPNKIKR